MTRMRHFPWDRTSVIVVLMNPKNQEVMNCSIFNQAVKTTRTLIRSLVPLGISVGLPFMTAQRATAAATYFSWDAESTVTAVGPDITVFKSNSSLSTDTAHTGSKSMKLIIIGPDSGNQPVGALGN
jgi:hypothetical protein